MSSLYIYKLGLVRVLSLLFQGNLTFMNNKGLSGNYLTFIIIFLIYQKGNLVQISSLKAVGLVTRGIGVQLGNLVFENNTVANGFPNFNNNFKTNSTIGYYLIYFNSISSTIDSIMSTGNISFIHNGGSGFTFFNLIFDNENTF